VMAHRLGRWRTPNAGLIRLGKANLFSPAQVMSIGWENP
jgi:hypothetical protein